MKLVSFPLKEKKLAYSLIRKGNFFNNYKAILDFLFSCSRGLDRSRCLDQMRAMCKACRNPEQTFLTIHVAGTNGKGSVCTKIASALTQEGYGTALYTSPHISTFRERIQIGGILISEEEMVSLWQSLYAVVSDFNPTFFEWTTLLAFSYFQQKKVDIAVIETGLGGRVDPTNVITPLVSVITSIGYDHEEVLGFSLEEITREKSGILKKGVPFVIGAEVPVFTFERLAQDLRCQLYQNENRSLDFDEDNQNIARLALKALKLPRVISEISIERGLQAKAPCRFERHSFQKEVVLDVAHNVHGFHRLWNLLHQMYPHYFYRFVIAFSKGKRISESAHLIQTNAHSIHLVQTIHSRLYPASELKSLFLNSKVPIYVNQTVEEVLQGAFEVAPLGLKEVIVVAGSFFIMTEARKALGLSCLEDPPISITP